MIERVILGFALLGCAAETGAPGAPAPVPPPSAPPPAAGGGAGGVAVGGASGEGAGGSGGAAGLDPGPKQPKVPAPGQWISVQKGSYLAGAPKAESCNESENQLEHAVTLTHDFELSKTEITFAEYQAAFGAPHPQASSCADCPVNLVSWHRAAEICNAYSVLGGLTPCYACAGGVCAEALPPAVCRGYRLPTEAEWEYAYRAGTKTPLYNGDIAVCGGLDPTLDAIAWFLYNAGGGAHPVAGKEPNAWGFFDMSGNVWEWTHDGYVSDRSALPSVDPVGQNSEGLRVMRGGSYNCVPEELRGAHRSGLPGTISGNNVGVRCARTLD